MLYVNTGAWEFIPVCVALEKREILHLTKISHYNYSTCIRSQSYEMQGIKQHNYTVSKPHALLNHFVERYI